MNTISEGKIVSVTYDLYVYGKEDGNEELMEKATREQPLTFAFGIGMMLERFEENLRGKKTSDKFDFVISHEEAYGEYDYESIVDLPKSIFSDNKGKFDSDVIKEGQLVPLLDADGNRLNAIVVKIFDTVVKVDFNHPLAGEDLHFKGQVIEIRDSTEEDLKMFLSPGGCGGCTADCSEGGCGCGQ